MPLPAPARIAYLTGEYPAVSHTFILREVEALGALGVPVLTCSIRGTAAHHRQGPAEAAAAESTFYVLAAGKNPMVLLRAALAGLGTPGRLASAFRLAIRSSGPGSRALVWQMFYLAEALVLARHLRAEGVTHLHNHFADSSANVAMLTAEVAGIPFSYTLHGPAELFEPHRWALAEKTARARFVACISHYARSQCMFFSDPAHWHKLAIVHCGVIPELYDRPIPQTDGLHLVFVGRLTAIKGLRVLMEAMAAAHADRPDLRLTLVGDGPDRPWLEAAAASMDGAVRFAGYQSQEGVAEILAGADALVLPSFAEGVPVVLMEAMASGKPVIATQLAGVPELVEDGVSGLLVPPGDPAALAAAIGRLAGDAELRARMGEAGRAKVRAEFDVRLEAKRLLSLFRGTGVFPRPDAGS